MLICQKRLWLIAKVSMVEKYILVTLHLLIENCKGAITHDSTAISFAVLFEKPIILIPYVDMSKETLAYCEGFKRCLNIPMESFGKETYEFRSIDIKAYQKYKYDYLTHPKVAGRCNGEIMVRYIKWS